ncbi:hypothetical protein HZH68_013864 [Vespula germanica]|uniref:Uncharacterized protein n=1 Tax=Vespula germanica TaxID=30212 RepID=A0A834JBR5_VESGE|nr:hypothetical protein HZH68_013864 [Vespula germanica]
MIMKETFEFRELASPYRYNAGSCPRVKPIIAWYDVGYRLEGHSGGSCNGGVSGDDGGGGGGGGGDGEGGECGGGGSHAHSQEVEGGGCP